MKHATDMLHSGVASSRFVERIVTAQRRALFDAFVAFRQPVPAGTVLNMYMQPALPFVDSDYLSAWSDSEQRARITSHEVVLPARTRTGEIGEMRLPYPDNRFDWVFCNEVIEHVGRSDRQAALVEELYRVARKGVFLTTSNRRHPIEFKSGTPLIHLLPPAWWRRVLIWTGKSQWAAEGLLNLVDASALYQCAERLPDAPEHDVGHKRVFGIKAHFFLMILKRA